MDKRTVLAPRGQAPFDLLLENVRLVNVLTEEIYAGCLGLVVDEIAYAGPENSALFALQKLDGNGSYALPGLVDGHMHIESTMMTPPAFAQAVVPLGTTSCAADPHEIANVLGKRGVELLCRLSRGLPLRVHVMAPSTVPSAPGFETAGADLGAEDAREMLALEGILGLGEVMDFNGVISGDEKMLSIIHAALDAGVIVDGHAPTLHGADLQAFAAARIECDHTYMDVPTVREKLRLGLYVQIQERFLTPELMAYLNNCPGQSRLMLVTDDVPLTRLVASGHLNGVLRKAMAMGLEPLKAYRYATLNAADRLRLPDVGLLAPGRKADILLLDDLRDAKPRLVLCGGKITAKNGCYLPAVQTPVLPGFARGTVRMAPLTEDAFDVYAAGDAARVNAIEQDGKTSRTSLRQLTLPVRDGRVQYGPCAKMAVFDRHRAGGGHAVGFLCNMEGFDGAIATTYAHDCHNLTVYGSNDADMLLCANALIGAGGGLAVAKRGELLCLLPLPVAGILSEDSLAALAPQMAAFEAAVLETHLPHAEALTFVTLMALAVSPCAKLTDRGLVDTVNKRFVPVVACEEAEA